MTDNESISESSETPPVSAPDTGPLDPRAVLASAHRVWARAFNAAGMGGLSEGSSPANLLEYLARAALTDAIALVCDGVACGLTEHAESVLRGFGDPESAQAKHDFEAMTVADRAQAFPVGIEARYGRAIAALRSLDCRSVTARELVHRILQGRGTVADADRLARLLAVEEAMPAAQITAAFDAANELARDG